MCHPLVNFLYFALVIGFSMFFDHPACITVSLVCAAVYAVKIRGGEEIRRTARFLVPSALFVAVINPMFNHRGVTVLFYLPGGNQLTLESVLYGAAAAASFSAALLWFIAFTEVMTGDKFVYLFGRIIPALSLVLSMALRFVPRFAEQLKAAWEARAYMGLKGRGTGLKTRVKAAFSAFSATVTLALENSVDTVDSMKSRGYGLKGRTAFSIYRFTVRDKILLAWMCGCGIYIICGRLAGALSWRWFPAVAGAGPGAFNASFPAAYLALCLVPAVLDMKDERQWKYLKSKI